MPSVKKTKTAGIFEVTSQHSAKAYKVEVNLKAARGTDPCSLVIDCGRWGHVQEGPISKHAGAVLLALASESRGKATQIPALPAGRSVSSPVVRA
eukprot:14368320-Alexandrium_andersonii.AAC.1